MVTLLALASSALWGASDFCGGYFTKRINAVRVVAVAQLGGLVADVLLVLVLMLFFDGLNGGSWPLYGVLAGLTGAIGLVSFYAALSMGAMGVVSPIAALGAVLPVVLGLLTGDSVSLLAGCGLVFILIGVVLASGPELSGGTARLPMMLACLAAMTFGASLYFMDLAASSDVVGGLLAMRIASVTLLFTLWRLWPGGLRGGRVTRRDVVPLILIGLGDLGANLLFSIAASKGMVSVVSVLGSLYPVATLFLARVILKERLKPVQLVGVCLAFVGIAAVVA